MTGTRPVDPPVADPACLPVAECWYRDKRIAGLARFALAITVLNILGHLWLGFEQSWATPLVALAAAYATEFALEFIESRDLRRPPRYAGEGAIGVVKFLLSAHVSALAVGMLLMPLEQLWVVAFAASLAVASKYLVRVRIDGKRRHALNPSNFGIVATLILFPSVGIAPPYQFAEGTHGVLDWLLPALVICTGSLLNLKLTGRIPLILAWVGGFLLQAVLRSVVNGTPVLAALLPVTGFAFILFSFYMITDPATTPARRRNQILFGLSVAGLYGLFMELHIVFGMFYALAVATGLRACWFGLALPARLAQRAAAVAEPAE